MTNKDRLEEFFKVAQKVIDEHDGCSDEECSQGSELASLITQLKRDFKLTNV